jgi:guanylate kinase
VLCAPSGTGKSTLVNRLKSEFDAISYSVSYTTRSPRPGESPGVDYHFVTPEEFTTRLDAGFFAEWAEVHGNLYGTPKQATADLLDSGRDVVFDIDVQGAAQLKENFPQGIYVFLLPPSRQALEARLARRGANDAQDLHRRLENARKELQQADWFDYWVVNDDLDKAHDEFRSIYVSGRTAPSLNPGLMDRILASWSSEADGES